MVTNSGTGTGGPYCSHNLDSKSGCLVIDALRLLCMPSDKEFDAYPNATDLLDTMPVYCYDKYFAKVAACLSGHAGPCSNKAKMLRHWLLRHGAHSEHL